MITYTELRRLSLDFRRLSSNFLNSTDDTAATMIQRFKKYIDDTPFISGIISDAIGEVDYDWQNCFRQSKHSGWHEIEVPVDEACHVKAMYDYLDYIISNGSNILGIAMHYPHSQKKFNEIIQHFLDIAFRWTVKSFTETPRKQLDVARGMFIWYNNRVSDYTRRPRGERSEQTAARTCATSRSYIMAGVMARGHGILISFHRAKPLTEPKENAFTLH